MQTKVLMVCLGNICRSPLAQGILESKVDNNAITVDSAGTAAYHVGELPDERSIKVAKKYGIDLTKQRARKFSVTDFDTFDYIYVMDKSNYQNVIALAKSPEHKKKVKLILEEVFPGKNIEVPDPYYGGEQGFENVYSLLDKACDEIAKNLTEKSFS